MQTPPIRHHIKVCQHGYGCDACCWPWTAAKSHYGYGRTRANCFGRVETYAHRIVWAYDHECRIPKGKFISHTCENPGCCNPRHLEIISMALHHVRIGARRKQARSNGLPWGNTKLTQAQVLSILRRGKSGRESQQQIADSVGCSQVNIGYILSGKTWKHLHEAS